MKFSIQKQGGVPANPWVAVCKTCEGIGIDRVVPFVCFCKQCYEVIHNKEHGGYNIHCGNCNTIVPENVVKTILLLNTNL